MKIAIRYYTKSKKGNTEKIDLTYTQCIVMMVMWEKHQVNEKELCKTLSLKTNTLALY